MIVYSLACAKGHGFEGWFKDSVAYDAQAADGKLICPVCNSKKIAKAPMAPSVSGTKKKGEVAVPQPAAAELTKMRALLKSLREQVVANADNVGREFPEEARKIHYGEVEERAIYGEASLGEAKELLDEGIAVALLPPDLSEAN